MSDLRPQIMYDGGWTAGRPTPGGLSAAAVSRCYNRSLLTSLEDIQTSAQSSLLTPYCQFILVSLMSNVFPYANINIIL